eukprot:symbB.v1.2.009436.t1/scaffold597.1/size183257/7
MALLDLAVFFKLVFRFGCWCRQMVSKSTSTSHVVQQLRLRLPCHPEHFEIHSEDEEITPRPVALEDLEMQHLRLQLEEARAQIQAVEKDLLEQKEMNAILKEELREKEVQSDDAVAVLQAELQVSQKELLECQEEANVMRVQLDALAELRNGKVPCQDCLSVFADWLKESFKEMAVQIPRQLQPLGFHRIWWKVGGGCNTCNMLQSTSWEAFLRSFTSTDTDLKLQEAQLKVFVSMVDHHPGSFVQYITKLRQKRWPEDNGTEGAPEKAAVTTARAKTGPRLRVCSCYIVSL